MYSYSQLNRPKIRESTNIELTENLSLITGKEIYSYRQLNSH